MFAKDGVDLFAAIGKVDAICITTNGFINTKGECVMGRGCAKEATLRWPGVAKTLANRIKMFGNTVNHIGNDSGTDIYAFPVKPISNVFDGYNAVEHMRSKYSIGEVIPGWACVADIDVILKSTKTLISICDTKQYKTIVIPQPGCGAGGLLWRNVCPRIEKIFDDRFCIVSK